MSPDDIDSIVLKLHDFLFRNLGCSLDEDDDYVELSDFMHSTLGKFITRDRNYN
jgi:hypothetical protein